MPVKFAAAPVVEHAPAAHEQVLRGRYLFRQRGADNLLAAIEAFKSAIAIEPGYADAWSGLAQALVVVPYHPRAGGNVKTDAQAMYAQAFDAANRALAIDPDSSAALAARANAREARDFDWRGAENDFRAAISADERDVTAHQWYAEMLTAQRRWDEANAQYEIALAIDPLAPVVIFSQGTLLQYRGDSAGALARYDAALRLDPGLQAAQNMKQAALVDLKRYDEALSMAQAWPEPMRSVLAAIIAAKRDPARKPEAIRRILADDFDIIKAGHLASIGAYDQALDELEREFDAQVPLRELTWCQPAFEPLHDNPRFKALLKRINLPPESAAASK
jgi:tetratricopeptide (TPR) repeat protein